MENFEIILPCAFIAMILVSIAVNGGLDLYYDRIKPFAKKILFWLLMKPVYRKDVLISTLKRLNRGQQSEGGLCNAIENEMRSMVPKEYHLDIHNVFPLFNIGTAKDFNASMKHNNYGFWWPAFVWDTGRLDYLKWLIEQYKNDKRNLLNPFSKI